MSLKPFAAVFAAVLAFGVAVPEIATAQTQTPPAQTPAPTQGAATPERRTVLTAPPVVNRGRRNRDRAAAPAMTPEQIKAAAQVVLAATNTTCEIGEALLLGEAGEGKNVYEVTCAAGGGYLAYATEPPLTASCLELASASQIERTRDPNAAQGQLCTLPANTNLLPIYSQLAQTAGVSCTVDEGILAGRNTQTGAITYEIGCANQSGYWIRQNADGVWAKYVCFDLVLQNNTRCRFTTPEEITTSWTAALVDTAAAACEPASERRRIGVDANGHAVFELKCASGDGYIVRIDAATDKVARVRANPTSPEVIQVLPCAQATHIDGGCKIGTPAAAPAPGGRP